MEIWEAKLRSKHETIQKHTDALFENIIHKLATANTENERLKEIIKQQSKQLQLALEDRQDAVDEKVITERELAVMRRAFKIAIYANRECDSCPYKEVAQPEGEEVCLPDGCEKWCIDRARGPRRTGQERRVR